MVRTCSYALVGVLTSSLLLVLCHLRGEFILSQEKPAHVLAKLLFQVGLTSALHSRLGGLQISISELLPCMLRKTKTTIL